LALVPQMIDCVRWVPTLLEQDPFQVLHVDRTVQERRHHHITKCYHLTILLVSSCTV
jgi:hypothetical protein